MVKGQRNGNRRRVLNTCRDADNNAYIKKGKRKETVTYIKVVDGKVQ